MNKPFERNAMNVHYYQAQIRLMENIAENLIQHSTLPNVAASVGVGQSGIDALKPRLEGLLSEIHSIHADMTTLALTSSDDDVVNAARKGED